MTGKLAEHCRNQCLATGNKMTYLLRLILFPLSLDKYLKEEKISELTF